MTQSMHTADLALLPVFCAKISPKTLRIFFIGSFRRRVSADAAVMRVPPRISVQRPSNETPFRASATIKSKSNLPSSDINVHKPATWWSQTAHPAPNLRAYTRRHNPDVTAFAIRGITMLSPRSARPFVPRLRNLCERVPICACAAARQARPLEYQARVLTSSSSQRSWTSTQRSFQKNSFDAAAHKYAPAERSLASRTVMVVACLGAVLFYFSTSQRVPVTGRRRFSFLSDEFVECVHAKIGDDIVQMVHDQGGHFLPAWDPRTILVKRVMRKLIPVSGLPDLNWEISVVADDSTWRHWASSPPPFGPIIKLHGALTTSN